MASAPVSLESLLVLVAALRDRGWRISTHQVLAARRLISLLHAADAARAAATPPADADDDLRRHLAPVFCTTAREQREFAAVFGDWRGTPPIPPEPPPTPSAEAQRRRAWWAAAALAGLMVLALCSTNLPDPRKQPTDLPARQQAPSTVPPSAPPDPAADTRQALRWGTVAVAALPLCSWVAWLMLQSAGRPRLRRGRLRTPPELHSVYLPGGLRSLWAGLPLRRLAQALRSRLTVDSQALLVEPTIAATLKAGGNFVPVRGTRMEPEYLVLIDRASTSDHVALLADEVVNELQAGDVQIQRLDLEVNSGRARPRPTELAPLVATQAVVRTAATARVVAEAMPAERHLHSNHQRVLLFSDGEGFFDGYTGEPRPWLLGLLGAPMVVLVTPVPRAQWSERERSLQLLGVLVFELSPAGLSALVSAVDGTSAAALEPRAGTVARSHEGAALRWLQRDVPAAVPRQRLMADLQRGLGPRGFAWLAACAAYPEVNFGVTLRLGAALVPEPAQFATTLLALSRTVWMRRAYMPDWLRQELLARMPAPDAARVRQLLLSLLDRAQTNGRALPLHIGLDNGSLAEEPQAQTWTDRLHAWVRAAMRRDALARQARAAADDGPLRDHVLLQFLQGRPFASLDIPAPVGLLQALRVQSRRLGWTGTVLGASALLLTLVLIAALPFTQPVAPTPLPPAQQSTLPAASSPAPGPASAPPSLPPAASPPSLPPAASAPRLPLAASALSAEDVKARQRAEETQLQRVIEDLRRRAAEPAGVSAPEPVAPASGPVVNEKVTFAADVFFQSGSAAIDAAGQNKLLDLYQKSRGISLEVIIAVGHSDTREMGSVAERQALSVQRADNVKRVLVGLGIEANRVYTVGKGGEQPVADGKTSEGSAKNRRVEIEVVATRVKR